MKKVFKRIVWFLIVPLGMLIGPLFFDRRYLQGRHFTNGEVAGWRWMWRSIFLQKLMGFNRAIRFPCSPFIRVSNSRNLEHHPDDLNNFQHHGCYYQCFDAKITIGHGTYIAPNVGLITANHDPLDPDKHVAGAPIVIGKKCWIGMNAVVLPGVILGDHTVVAAGAVVTKSFPEGHCIVGGVPAKLLRSLMPNVADEPVHDPAH